MDVCLRVLKESNKSRFDNYSVRNSVLIISHITFRDCHVHIFSDNLSRNSCIYIPVLLLAILYSIIFIKLKTREHPGEPSANTQQQRNKRSRNALQMSIAIVTVFCALLVTFNHNSV